MNLTFVKTGIGQAENAEGALVRAADRELLIYERGASQIPVEINYLEAEALIHRPLLPADLPDGMAPEEVFSEIKAGADAITRRPVKWA